jgi:hypothetical protein
MLEISVSAGASPTRRSLSANPLVDSSPPTDYCRQTGRIRKALDPGTPRCTASPTCRPTAPCVSRLPASALLRSRAVRTQRTSPEPTIGLAVRCFRRNPPVCRLCRCLTNAHPTTRRPFRQSYRGSNGTSSCQQSANVTVMCQTRFVTRHGKTLLREVVRVQLLNLVARHWTDTQW